MGEKRCCQRNRLPSLPRRISSLKSAHSSAVGPSLIDLQTPKYTSGWVGGRELKNAETQSICLLIFFFLFGRRCLPLRIYRNRRHAEWRNKCWWSSFLSLALALTRAVFTVGRRNTPVPPPLISFWPQNPLKTPPPPTTMSRTLLSNNIDPFGMLLKDKPCSLRM